MKDFDKIYDLFEEACENADEGIYSEKDLRKFEEVLEKLGTPEKGKADEKATLYAYCLAHLANATFSLAEFEYDSDDISEQQALDRFADADKRFKESQDIFSAMQQTNDRDYLYADACQMYAEFISYVCCDSEKRGLHDLKKKDIENLYRKSIDMYENLLNCEGYDTRDELIDVCYNAAGYFYGKDMYEKSHPLFERAKALAEEIEGEEPGSYSDLFEIIDDYLKEGKDGKLFV